MSWALQVETAEAVGRLYRQTGTAPTYRQVGAVLGLTSPATVLRRLADAAEAGLLTQVGTAKQGRSQGYIPRTPGHCPLCMASLPNVAASA
jgi:LexA DNA binding domain